MNPINQILCFISISAENGTIASQTSKTYGRGLHKNKETIGKKREYDVVLGKRLGKAGLWDPLPATPVPLGGQPRSLLSAGLRASSFK